MFFLFLVAVLNVAYNSIFASLDRSTSVDYIGVNLWLVFIAHA